MLCKTMIIMMEITTGVGISAIVCRKALTERPAATFASTVTGSTPGVKEETIAICGALHSSISTAAAERSQT
jgi:hypothetical protein